MVKVIFLLSHRGMILVAVAKGEKEVSWRKIQKHWARRQREAGKHGDDWVSFVMMIKANDKKTDLFRSCHHLIIIYLPVPVILCW